MRVSGRLLAVALAAVLLCAGCDSGPDLGAPDELSQKDSAALADERLSLDAALKTEAELNRSPQAARKLRDKVQAIVSEGSFETEELDEFGLAALGRLGLLVPNLVRADSDGVPVSLDIEATRDFLRYAELDPARALLVPAEKIVDNIESVVKRSAAGSATRIVHRDRGALLDLSVEEYLQEAEDDTEPIWPDLSGRLHVLREGL